MTSASRPRWAPFPYITSPCCSQHVGVVGVERGFRVSGALGLPTPSCQSGPPGPLQVVTAQQWPREGLFWPVQGGFKWNRR